MNAASLAKYLIFPDNEALIKYAETNGVNLDVRMSKSTKEEIFFAKSGAMKAEHVKDISYLEQFIYSKRDKKYFLT